MESVYLQRGGKKPDKGKKDEKEPEKQKQKEKAKEEESAAQAALSMIQSGFVSSDDFSATELRALASVVGNQKMLQAFADSDENRRRNFRLYTIKIAGEPRRGLPENFITVSWPALRPVVDLNRKGPLPAGVFPVDALCEQSYSDEVEQQDGQISY